MSLLCWGIQLRHVLRVNLIGCMSENSKHYLRVSCRWPFLPQCVVVVGDDEPGQLQLCRVSNFWRSHSSGFRRSLQCWLEEFC